MASHNRVLLLGNLTRNPELRFTPSGTAVCDIGLAMNEKYKNSAGEEVETACFVDVVVWGRQAETSAEHLKKGSSVFVEGKLQLDTWESKEGDKRSRLRVRADRVVFLGKSHQNDGKDAHGANEDDSGGNEDDGAPF